MSAKPVIRKNYPAEGVLETEEDAGIFSLAEGEFRDQKFWLQTGSVYTAAASSILKKSFWEKASEVSNCAAKNGE